MDSSIPLEDLQQPRLVQHLVQKLSEQASALSPELAMLQPLLVALDLQWDCLTLV